jgi:hypothetical protein
MKHTSEPAWLPYVAPRSSRIRHPGTYFPQDGPATHDIPEKAIRESKPDAAEVMPIAK